MSCCGGNKTCGGQAEKPIAPGGGHTDEEIKDGVKEYYGKVLQKTENLKTNACTMGAVKLPKHVREAMGMVHEEVTMRFYGCGLVVPEHVEGTKILDLGSGSGQDCYTLSKLVGESGHVTGIDMTKEQLEVANRYLDYHREKFGYAKSNVDYVEGYIEKLTEAGLKEDFYDCIVSNCVVNLSPDKDAVLREAYKVLKEGGEFFFSDVYANSDLPTEVRKHKVLWGECISGALWWKDLHRIAKEVGFSSPCLVRASRFTIDEKDKALADVVGDAKFLSVTYRLFKLPKEKIDGSTVTYNGSFLSCEKEFQLGWNHKFPVDEAVDVGSEVAAILKSSRFESGFTFQPPTKKSCSGDEEEEIMDPFKYVDQLEASGVKVSAPCCGGGKKESAPACGGKPCGEKSSSCGGKPCGEKSSACGGKPCGEKSSCGGKPCGEKAQSCGGGAQKSEGCCGGGSCN